MTKPLDQIAEYDAVLGRLAGQIARTEEQHRATAAELRAAEEAVAAYHRDTATGEAAEDDAVFDRLLDNLQKIQSRVNLDAQHGRLDIRAAAQADKLRREAAEIQADRDAYIRSHRAEVIEAMMAESHRCADEQAAAFANAGTKVQAWTVQLQRWGPLLEPLGLSGRDLPHTNAAGEALKMYAFQAANAATVPAPQSLVEQPEPVTIDARTRREPITAQ